MRRASGQGCLDLRIGGLIIASMKRWMYMVALLGGVLVSAGTVRAQVRQLDSDVPRISEPPSQAIPWGIALVASGGILLIAFKNAKRNHLD